MLKLFRFIMVILALFGVFLPLNALSADHPNIRVAIFKDISSFTVRAARGNLVVMSEGTGQVVAEGREMRVRSVAGAVRVNGTPIAGAATIKGKPALYYIGNKKFRGVIRVYPDGADSLLVTNELDLEDYLAGLINSEIFSHWPIEAVKAQAVASRTYALHQIAGTNKHSPVAKYDVESTIADQVYDGAHREDKRAYEGVRATTGMVMTKNGIIFPAFYHSACGGYSENANNVWSGAGATTTKVDKYCRNSPHRAWFLRMPKVQFLAILTGAGVIDGKHLVRDIGMIPFSDSPRADVVVLTTDSGQVNVKATELRRILGYNRLKSTWFNVGFEGDEIVFAGRGFGHGVGLCQWGAKRMAEEGNNYKEILKHYYPEAEMGRMY